MKFHSRVLTAQEVLNDMINNQSYISLVWIQNKKLYSKLEKIVSYFNLIIYVSQCGVTQNQKKKKKYNIKFN
jgi:hypothetical protein